MDVTLYKYCATLNSYYDNWQQRFEYERERTTKSLKNMDDSMYCSELYESFKNNCFCVTIGAIYASLFSSYCGMEFSQLYIKKDKQTKELKLLKAENWSWNFPNAEDVFNTCYDNFSILIKTYEELYEIRQKMNYQYHILDNFWFFPELTHNGFKFTFSTNYYSIGKRIEFFQKAGAWQASFRAYSYDEVKKLKSSMLDIFTQYSVDVGELEKSLFTEPPKKKSFWSNFFRLN